MSSRFLNNLFGWKGQKPSVVPLHTPQNYSWVIVGNSTKPINISDFEKILQEVSNEIGKQNEENVSPVIFDEKLLENAMVDDCL